MSFATLEDIKNLGFTGFIPICQFHTSKQYHIIPKADGIYLILRVADTPCEFHALNPSRMHSKHKNNPVRHSYDVNLLSAKSQQVKDTIVVYIGKAGGGSHRTSLHQRLKAYIEAGRTMPGQSSHAGGRAIWQLKDSADLIVCWKPSDNNEDAIEVEHRLLDEFKSTYGSLPLANWKR
jgi:hypothetical protein